MTDNGLFEIRSMIEKRRPSSTIGFLVNHALVIEGGEITFGLEGRRTSKIEYDPNIIVLDGVDGANSQRYALSQSGSVSSQFYTDAPLKIIEE